MADEKPRDPQAWIPKKLRGRTFHQVGFIGRVSGVAPETHCTEKTFAVRRADGNHEVYAR